MKRTNSSFLKSNIYSFYLLVALFFMTTKVVAQNDNTSFIVVWKANTDGEIILPLVGGTSYNFNLKWKNMDDSLIGDTTIMITPLTNISHIIDGLTAGDTFRLIISDSFPVFRANEHAKSDLLKIEQWGNINWTSFANAFEGCVHLDITATNAPKLDSVTDCSNMFKGCTALIGETASWNWSTGSVTNMNGMFSGASSFNQNLGSWILDNSVTLLNFLDSTAMSCENYSNTLIGWVGQTYLPDSITIGVQELRYSGAGIAAHKMLEQKWWTFIGEDNVVQTADSIHVKVCYSNMPYFWNWNSLTYHDAGTYLDTVRTSINPNSCMYYVPTSLHLVVETDVSAGEIQGPSALETNKTAQYTTSGTAGGYWSSSNLHALNIDPITGQAIGTASGQTVITYTVANSCGVDQVDFPVEVKAGVNTQTPEPPKSSIEDFAISQLALFPNPVSDRLHLSFYLQQTSDVSIQLIDIRGAILRTEQVNGQTGKNELIWDMTHYAAGIYSLVIRTNDTLVTRRLIK